MFKLLYRKEKRRAKRRGGEVNVRKCWKKTSNAWKLFHSNVLSLVNCDHKNFCIRLMCVTDKQVTDEEVTALNLIIFRQKNNKVFLFKASINPWINIKKKKKSKKQNFNKPLWIDSISLGVKNFFPLTGWHLFIGFKCGKSVTYTARNCKWVCCLNLA